MVFELVFDDHLTDVELVSKLGYLLISDLAGNAST